MRLNKFERLDRWYPWFAFMDTDIFDYIFYDYVYFNQDTFKVKKDQIELGEIYWRIDGD